MVFLIGLVAIAAVPADDGERFATPLGLPLITTRIAKIQAALGPAQVTEAGHHEASVCYSWPEPRAIVTFMVQGEGPSGQFAMATPSDQGAGCARVEESVAKARPLQVGGLTLGMAKSEAKGLLGKAEWLSPERARVTYERTEPVDRVQHPQTVGDAFYITITVEARFERDRLAELVVLKVAST